VQRVPVGLPGPDALEIGPRTLRAGGVLHQTLAVTGYPREIGPGWLQPLLDHPGPVDLAVYVEPLATVVAAERLRRQLARLESSQRLDAAQGRLDDPQLDTATHDAHQLARRLATGQGRLLRVGLYVTVRGHTPAELDHELARVQGLLGSLLLDAYPVTFRALQGWLTTLPLGLDQLRLHRTMDTAAVAASFPFASADLPLPPTGGVLTRYASRRSASSFGRLRAGVCPPSISSWGIPRRSSATRRRNDSGNSRSSRQSKTRVGTSGHVFSGDGSCIRASDCGLPRFG
jgi:hypothetical protein